MFAGLTKLAVLLGHDTHQYFTSVVVIDLEDPSKVCKNLADVPRKLLRATGTLFDNSKPMYCGGYSIDLENPQCACYAYEQSQWVLVTEMPTCRYILSSADLKNQDDGRSRFVVAGGFNTVTTVTDVVEVYDGTSWQSLPNLPYAVNGHCMVSINETTLVLIGGSEHPSETYFYNSEYNQWLPGPRLLVERNRASCATVNWINPADGQLGQVVVVAGGYRLGALSSVELLYINDIDSGWQAGPEMNKTAHNAVLVEYKNSLVLVGGLGTVDGKHLYQLSSPEGPWIEMEQTLPGTNIDHIAFLIPDEITDCESA